MSAIDRGWDKRRLRRLLGAFFVALIIPTALLSWQAYSRLKWESFHRYQLLAEELVGRIDQRLSRLIAEQEARSFADYGFLVVEGAPSANYLQRSPLAEFPIAGDLPGLLGHFQIDAQGRFSTPLLPDADAGAALAHGISDRELAQRQAAKQRLFDILSRQRLVSAGGRTAAADEPTPAPAAEPALAQKARPPTGASLARERRAAPKATAREQVTQAVFDQLEEQPARPHLPKPLGASGRLGRVDELKLEQPFAGKESRLAKVEQTPRKDQDPMRRGARKELSVLPLADRRASDEDESAPPRPAAAPRVTIFESAIDPFGFGLLESGHFVLYRKVWRNGQRYIQGALIDPRAN